MTFSGCNPLTLRRSALGIARRVLGPYRLQQKPQQQRCVSSTARVQALWFSKAAQGSTTSSTQLGRPFVLGTQQQRGLRGKLPAQASPSDTRAELVAREEEGDGTAEPEFGEDLEEGIDYETARQGFRSSFVESIQGVRDIYDVPCFYDVAFGFREYAGEADFLMEVANRFIGKPPTSALEVRY